MVPVFCLADAWWAGPFARCQSPRPAPIDIDKVFSEAFPVYINPDFASAALFGPVGADNIALDCTPRPLDGVPVAGMVRPVLEELKLPVFADMSSRDEGLLSERTGARQFATTLPRCAGRGAVVVGAVFIPHGIARDLTPAVMAHT